jgi:hypothetical protein
VAVKAAATPKPAAVPVPSFQDEEKSTVLSTAVAGVLAVVTWGTAGVLAYYSMMSQ